MSTGVLALLNLVSRLSDDSAFWANDNSPDRHLSLRGGKTCRIERPDHTVATRNAVRRSLIGRRAQAGARLSDIIAHRISHSR